jgi:hypothetical protein
VIRLLGLTIHDPDVVFTDLGLALLAAFFAWRLWTGRTGVLPRLGAVLMAALASAAFWGAIFHAFFPGQTSTAPGYIAWMPVALSIGAAAATMVDLALRVIVPGLAPRSRRAIVAVYAAGFAAVVFLVDESFTSIVLFYVPALVLFLLGARLQTIRTHDRGWRLITVGLLITVGAALLQQAKLAIHVEYFDHNAVYHVLQGIALAFLYVGFREVPESRSVYATGGNPAPRPG